MLKMFCFNSPRKKISKMFKMGNGISATGPSKQITSLSRNTPSHRPTQRQTQVRWARLQRPSLGLSLYQKQRFHQTLTSRVSKKQRMFDAQVPGHEKHQEHLKCWRNKIFGHASSRPIIRALKKSRAKKGPTASHGSAQRMSSFNHFSPFAKRAGNFRYNNFAAGFFLDNLFFPRTLDFSPSCTAIHHWFDICSTTSNGKEHHLQGRGGTSDTPICNRAITSSINLQHEIQDPAVFR